MVFPETLKEVRYLTDANGEKTDVLIPLATWKKLLVSWERLSEMLEDQEDRAVLREWLAKRAAGEADSLSLDELEQDLRADGLLPG
jgi:hypothetical protein